MKRPSISAALLAALLMSASSAHAEMEWLVAPYIWGPSITVNQQPDDGSGSGEDLLDKLNAAGLIRIEAAQNHWGGTLDYIFIGFSDAETIGAGGSVPIDVNSNLDATILELGGFYRLSGQEDGAHLLFGYRGIDIETSILFTPRGFPTERVDTDTTLNDVFLGARYLHRFNDRWDFSIRGDYSFGDTDGVVNTLTSVGFRFNEAFAMNFGYRYADLKYKVTSDEGETLDTEVEFSGFLIGFLFRFES